MRKLIKSLIELLRVFNGALPCVRDQNKIYRELYEELKVLVEEQRQERAHFQKELLRLEKLINRAFECDHRSECPVIGG
ncbi:MAG: hypothetical protein ACRC6V_15700 [Bacteroidales bacterium]